MASPKQNKNTEPDLQASTASFLKRYKQSKSPTIEQQGDVLDVATKEQKLRVAKDLETTGGWTQKDFVKASTEEQYQFLRMNPNVTWVPNDMKRDIMERALDDRAKKSANIAQKRMDEIDEMLTEYIDVGDYKTVDYEKYASGQEVPNKSNEEKQKKALSKIKVEYGTTVKPTREHRYPEGSPKWVELKREWYALKVERDAINGMREIRTYDPKTKSYKYIDPVHEQEITKREYENAYEAWSNPYIMVAHEEVRRISNNKNIDHAEKQRQIQEVLLGFNQEDGTNSYLQLANKYGFIYDEYGAETFDKNAEIGLLTGIATSGAERKTLVASKGYKEPVMTDEYDIDSWLLDIEREEMVEEALR